MGDAAGIGPEILVKALNEKDIYDISKPLIIGDKDRIDQALRVCNLDLAVNVVEDLKDGKYEYGTIDIVDLNKLLLRI